MKTIKIKLMEPIEGYEDVAEIRVPESGEWFLGTENEVRQWPRSSLIHCLASYPVLTPKKTLAESLGLEVGAVYAVGCKEGTPFVIYVDDKGCLREQNPLSGGTNSRGCSSWRFIKNLGYRKVINPDGSMVDGDIEWVEVGGKWVTKVDLLEASHKVHTKDFVGIWHMISTPICDY